MNREIFESNVRFLSEKNQLLCYIVLNNPLNDQFAIRLNNKGLPILYINNKPIEDEIDPNREAERSVKNFFDNLRGKIPKELRVFGLGLGYHIEHLLSRFEGSTITVFEPEPMFLRALCESRDVRNIIEKVQFRIGISEIPWDTEFDYLHLPSIRYHKQFLEILRKRKLITSGRLPALRLNVVVVGPIDGGTLGTAQFVKNAFENLGYNVTFIDPSKFVSLYNHIYADIKSGANQTLLLNEFARVLSKYCAAVIADVMPHLVLAVAQAPLHPEELVSIREAGIPTAMWFVENHRVITYWKDVASKYDFFFIIQKGKFEEILDKIGITAFHYVPLAADPEIHKPLELDSEERKRYGSQVSFMGAGYYNRRHILRGLVGYDLKIWGNGWGNNGVLKDFIQEGGRRISTEETVKVFNASTINLNIHSSQTTKGLEEKKDYINPRTYEIAASKAFQLVDHRTYLADEFDVQKEIMCFHSEQELRKLIDHFLANDKERAEFAYSAYNRVLRDHTYVHRVMDMLEFIWAHQPTSWLNGVNDMEVARKVMDEIAENDPDLKNFLDCMPKKLFYPLKEVISLMEINKGKLRDFELIFLMMDEIKKELCRKR